MLTDLLNHPVSPILGGVPAVNGTFIDQDFGGTVIKRMSNAGIITTVDGGRVPSASGVEYSTMSAFNADETAMLIAFFSVFEIRLTADDTRIQLPIDVSTASEPRWDRTDPKKFYFHEGNSIYSMDYTTGAKTLIHTFTEYSTIGFGGGESDISADDHYLVVDGNNKSEVFTFNLVTGVKSPVVKVVGVLDAAVLTPSNRVILSWNATGTARYNGEELYDTNMNFLKQILTFDTHKAVMKDIDGGDCMVFSPDTPGVQKLNIDTMKYTLLLNIGYIKPYIASHIAPTIGAADPSVFVSTYDNGNGTIVVYPFQDEVFQVFLSGTRPVQRWCHNRANPSSPYGNQPIQSTRSGRFLAFNSNLSGETDAYMFDTGVVPPPPPTPPTISTVLLHDGVEGTSYTATLLASGGKAPYTWAVSSGALPPGLTLAGGVISGTPTTPGVSIFVITVTDSTGQTATKSLSITVAAPATKQKLTGTLTDGINTFNVVVLQN